MKGDIYYVVDAPLCLFIEKYLWMPPKVRRFWVREVWQSMMMAIIRQRRCHSTTVA